MTNETPQEALCATCGHADDFHRSTCGACSEIAESHPFASRQEEARLTVRPNKGHRCHKRKWWQGHRFDSRTPHRNCLDCGVHEYWLETMSIYLDSKSDCKTCRTSVAATSNQGGH